MELSTALDRKQDIRRLPTPPAYVRQRMAQAAQELSRAGDIAMHVELANEVLSHYTAMLYEKTSDGFLANVDARTGRLLVAAPWGNKGWRHWGLRHWESVTLRRILMGRIAHPRHVPMFDYNADMRCWFLMLNRYPSFDHAQAYLKHSAVTLAEWRMWFKR